MSMDVAFDRFGSEADDAASWSPSDALVVGSSSPTQAFELDDLYDHSTAEDSFDVFTSSEEIPIPLMNFWKSPNQVNIKVTSSFDAWCSRYNFDPYRQDVPNERQFLSMLESPFIHIDSTALVLAIFYEYSNQAQVTLLKAAQYGKVEYDHLDVVAALSIQWYDAFFLSHILTEYPICTEEMLWYMVQRGPTPSNVLLLGGFLNKPLAKDIAWTFAHPLMHMKGPFGTSDNKLLSGFAKKLVGQAKTAGFPKKLCLQLKKALSAK